MTRRTLQLLVTALIALALGGATSSGALAQDDAGGESPTTVRVALNGFENNLTPFTVTHATGRPDDLLMMVYDSLFWSQTTDDPEPWLAQSATASDDNQTWTVKLRPNLTWHDGRPLTAEDVKFTFDYFDDAPPGRWTHHVTDVPPYESSEVVDEQTVRFRFSAPAPQFKILPGGDLPILPKHVWEDIERPGTATDIDPIGSGPYKVAEIVSDQRYRLEANEDYFKGKPLVDVIEMPVVRDVSAAFQALRTGQVDFVIDKVPPGIVDSLEEADGIEIHRGHDFFSTEIRFNARKEPFDNPDVRKAIALAIDRQALVDRVLQGDGDPGHDSWIHPESPWALPDAEGEYDTARAQGMLDAAGFRRQGQGIRQSADGERLAFTVLVSSRDPEALRALQLIEGQLREIGVDMSTESLDPAALSARTRPGPDGPPQHDAYLGTFDWHAHTDPDTLYFFFHSPGDKGIGAAFTGYSNERFDQLVERATTLEADERRPVMHEALEIFAEEVPMITLWYREDVTAYRPAAYDGWFNDSGHGLFTKRALLEGYAEQGTVDEVVDEAGDSWWWIVVAVVAVALLIAAVLVLRRRRSAAAEQSFE
ncbi:MAG: ABC transporter substrate-binding protein [Thermoleophilia bacterium]